MMEARKVTVTIIVESLSIDTLYGLLVEVAKNVEAEAENGRLRMNDGDSVMWQTKRQNVEF